MFDVVIAGIGQTDVGELYTISLRDLARQAILAAQADSGGLQPQTLFVGNMLAAAVSRQTHLGALIADRVEMTGIEAATIEAGSASGAAALRQAYFAVASGQAEVALAVGVEKVTDELGSSTENSQMLGADSDYEAVHGLTTHAQAALLMRRYLYETNAPRAAFAGFPITAHANAAHNPHAMYHSAISAEAYAKAGVVSEPLNLFDVAPAADGAAAVILARSDRLPKGFAHPLVRIAGASMATDRLALHDRPDMLHLAAVQASVQRACKQAGIAPGEVDLFELHDSSSIMAALSLEAAGFAARGEGWKLAQNGALSLSESLPIATFGGLKARGYPSGASGMYQAVEATLQLRGQAGPNQVPGARLAMIQALSGPAASAITHILAV